MNGLQWREYPIVDGVQRITCKSFIGFVDYIDSRHRTSNGLIWRGHAEESWILEPNIIRAIRLTNKHVAQEKNAIVNPAFVTSPGHRAFSSIKETLRSEEKDGYTLTDDELWAFAQHRGMYTPLLDWTRSPYVAAFFAFADARLSPRSRPSKKIIVWGLSTNRLVSNYMGVAESFPDLEYRYEYVIGDHFINQRLFAQQGVFTRVWPPLDIERLVRRRSKSESSSPPCLIRIEISKELTDHFLIHLNRMNVNYRSLFPDAEGACLHANLNFLLTSYEGRGSGPFPLGFASNE